MHMLHDYVAKQLADKIKLRRVVVWYDERGEFQSFVDEVRGGPRAVSEPVPVAVAGAKPSLAEFSGSMFELRTVIEPYVSGDTPEPIVVYIPGIVRHRRASVLMELEKAGATWEPQLKQLARNILLQKYTNGVVDELLGFDRKVSYEEIARAGCADSGTEPPSILKGIFVDARGPDALLIAWLGSDARDPEVVDKQATRELCKLVKARLGLDLSVEAPIAKLRDITLRYVLGGEFRMDLSCNAPTSLESVGKPATKDQESAIRLIAQGLRKSYANAYEVLADRVEDQLGLKEAKLPPGSLGSIDTFRFEERELLRHAGELISKGQYGEALALVAGRDKSFWLERDVSRRAQWEATRRMAELGNVAMDVSRAVGTTSGEVAVWLYAYVSKEGWFRLDRAQRRLEAWVANLDDEPEERPLGVVRRAYEDACQAMAEGFTKALVKGGWAVPGALHQTQVWSESVVIQPRPVAYFLVDAMRYEMGMELAGRLPSTSEVSVRAAIGALPSITPIGMAALQPGASASFSVVEQGGRLGARIGEGFLPDLVARKKHAAARIPKLVDLSLDELLSLQPSKLKKRLDGAQVVVVRSQEIDHAGETGFTFQARQVMDTVIDNLARAIRKLTTAGVVHSVVTADHGHLFSTERDESMRMEAPGGTTIELHRRCWIGRGGKTPQGCVRVSATTLGYDSDLDFVFPVGCGVFKSGGDLAFHHGGPTLQEVVVPVVEVRLKVAAEQEPSTGVEVLGAPETITNGIFSITLRLPGATANMFASPVQLRVILLGGGLQVGGIGMVVGAKLENESGILTLEPGQSANVALVLRDRESKSVRIVVQDPATDAELYRSPKEIPCDLEF
jgi:hypothetical protein